MRDSTEAKDALEELRLAALRATPGPWRFVVRKKGDPFAGNLIAAVAPGHQIVTKHEGGMYPSSDGEFIAAAREAVPALIEEIRAAKAENERLRAENVKLRTHNKLIGDASNAHALKLNQLAREFREGLWT
jgi:hypothetical protein